MKIIPLIPTIIFIIITEIIPVVPASEFDGKHWTKYIFMSLDLGLSQKDNLWCY